MEKKKIFLHSFIIKFEVGKHLLYIFKYFPFILFVGKHYSSRFFYLNENFKPKIAFHFST